MQKLLAASAVMLLFLVPNAIATTQTGTLKFKAELAMPGSISPIQGASVTICLPGYCQTETTNSNGIAKFTALLNESYTWTMAFCRPGLCETQTGLASINQPNITERITVIFT